MNALKFKRSVELLCVACIFAVLTPAILLGQELRIEIMDAYSGQHYTLDPHSEFDVQGSATFSPDQKWVAFDGNRKGEPFSKKRLFITKANGSQREPTDLVCGAMPSFSKDGTRIAYSSPDRGGVWVMDVEGESKEQVGIGNNAWSIRFSPQDNDVVAYSVYGAAGQNIQLHNLETDETRLLLPDDITKGFQQIVWNFNWSADGSQIVFVGKTPNKNEQGEVQRSFRVVAAVSTNEAEAEAAKAQIVTVENAYCRVLFHPTKNQIFYSKEIPSKGTHRIFSIDLDTPKKFRVPVYLASQPDERWNMIEDFSSDGNLIAFSSKLVPTRSATTSISFAKKIGPTLAAAAKLERAQTSLRQGDYESFVDLLMGELDVNQKKMLAKEVGDNEVEWLATIDEAVSRANKAQLEDDSVVFPIGGRDNLKMVKRDGQWVISAKQRQIQNEPMPDRRRLNRF